MTIPINLTRLSIETTRLCNLKCRMCLHHGPLYKGQSDNHPTIIDIDMFKSIIDQFRYMQPGDKYVSPHFQGEPLMYGQFLDACDYLNDHCIYINFTTNAMLLSKEITDILLTMKYFNCIAFSIDGFTKKTLENIRTGVSYEKIHQNIYYFLQRRNEYRRRDIGVSVNFVRMPENEHEIEAFVNHWVGIVDSVSTSQVTDADGRPTRIDFQPNRLNRPCLAPFYFAVVLTNGDVVPCCRDHQYKMVMGNVFKDGLEKVWNGEEYDYLRSIHERGLYNYNTINHNHLCANCDTWMCEYTNDLQFPLITKPGIVKMHGPFWDSYRRIS